MENILHEDNKNPAIQEVKAAMKDTKDKRMFERYQTVLLHLKGLTYEKIADIVGRSTVTIGSYIKAYHEGGLDGLKMGQSPGRPTFLTEEQEQELYQLIVEQRPADVGFPAEMNWNAPSSGNGSNVNTVSNMQTAGCEICCIDWASATQNQRTPWPKPTRKNK